MWDEHDILVIWHDVRASIAQEASSQGRQLLQGGGAKEQSAATTQRRRKWKFGRFWVKKGWGKAWGFLKKMKRAREEEEK